MNTNAQLHVQNWVEGGNSAEQIEELRAYLSSGQTFAQYTAEQAGWDDCTEPEPDYREAAEQYVAELEAAAR